MPPVSKAQARFLFAKKPKIAKKWEAEGEMNYKNLPEKVGKPKPGMVRVKLPKGF